jgi:hypothetical protein
MIHRNFEVTVKIAIVYISVAVIGCSGIVQGKKQKNLSSKESVPSYLKDYEKLYETDPHDAAVKWFKNARFGLFVHYALASLLEGGKPEYIELVWQSRARAFSEIYSGEV